MLRVMSLSMPPLPALPPEQFVVAPAQLRYEDLTQDGRLMPIALPPALGVMWQHVMSKHPGARATFAQGIVPILTRMTLVSHEQRQRPEQQVEVATGFQLARAPDGEKLFMNAWAEVRGPSGAPAGTLFAEHTFTRLMAPPEQRKVTRLGVPGYPEVPEAVYPQPAPASFAEAPGGAPWIDELASDPTPVIFSLDQTDSNQHVNSLVYLRVFLDAVWRRLASAGESTKLRSRALEIAYRKPCFAGDRVRVVLRRFEGGAAGFIEGEDGKPRCYVRALVGA